MSQEAKPDNRDQRSDLMRRLQFARLRAKLVLFVQRLIPALLPLTGIVCLFAAMSWFGLFRILPDGLRLVTGALILVGLALATVPLFRLGWPDSAAADRLVERDNELPHQAISVQFDQQSRASDATRQLWQEHQKRLAGRIGALGIPLRFPDLAPLDPYGLRVLPVLLVTIAYCFSASTYGGRLGDIFTAHTSLDEGSSVRIDAWVTQPAYTGGAPIYLSTTDAQDDSAIPVPQHSEITVRISGGTGDGQAVYTADNGKTTTLPFAPGPEAAARDTAALQDKNTAETATARFILKDSGSFQVGDRRWTFAVKKDELPVISFEGQPRRSTNGALEIGYRGRDDYGISQARAEIVPLQQDPSATPLYPLPEFRIDLPQRDSRTIKGVASRNLTEHPLAGQPVRIILVAKDGAGQEGRSQPLNMILPSRAFSEPVAASLAEQRQTFALDVSKVQHALDLSQALTIRPEETIPNTVHFLLHQSARTRLTLARSVEDLKTTADYFWQVALEIEDGDVALAERSLRDAQQALSDALSRNAPDAEIKKLMDELRQAMKEYLSAMQKRMQENPDSKAPQTAQNALREKDLQKMMDQLENLARSGSREEAQKLLNDMQRMMNNLQTARPQGQEQRQNSEMTKQIDKLGELLQNQQKLLDETFSAQKKLDEQMLNASPEDEGMDGSILEDPSAPGETPPEGSQAEPPQQGDSASGEQALRDALKDLKSRQDALSRQLEDLRKGLEDMGVKPGQGFGAAKGHMGDASQSLGRADGNKATDGQGKALQALRDGAKDLIQQLQGKGSGQGQAGVKPRMMDPLGREQQDNGEGLDSRVKVPDEIDIQRAREILESIRKKLETQPGPDLQRQYLERLLDLQ